MAELTLFGRAPVAGETKTRLIPSLGAEGAASLYRAFLEDITERFASAFDVRLACAGDLSHPDLQRLSSAHGLDLRAQASGGLGERMSHSLRQMSDDHGRGIIVGTDMPTLPKALVDLAFQKGQQALHEVFLGIIWIYRGDSAELIAERTRLSAPILKQDDRVGELNRRSRKITDINPETGAEEDLGSGVTTEPTVTPPTNG